MAAIDFSKVKILKKLGAGVNGTVHLCEYRNKRYALKREHIIPTDMKVDIDILKYIDKLTPSEQMFFTKCHGYEIYDKCRLKQKTVKTHDTEYRTLKNRSQWCIRYLLDYKGSTTLREIYTSLNSQQQISCILQIIHAILILKKSGYSHNDLHHNNIMVNKTDLETFSLQRHNVHFHGYQVSFIDYGEAFHKSYHTQAWYDDNFADHRLLFLSNPEQYFFIEIREVIGALVFNFWQLHSECERRKKKFPWIKNPNFGEDGCKLILKHYGGFFRAAAKKYVKIHPEAEKGIKNFVSRTKPAVLSSLEQLYRNCILERIANEFYITYPRMYFEYFQYCSKTVKEPPTFIPEEMALQYLRCRSVEDIINTLL
jgi:serine/threonine protein kinase